CSPTECRPSTLCWRSGSRSEREVERRTFVGLRVRPDATAMTRDDALDRDEPDAAARELCFGMQALERHEQLVCVLHVEADAIVAHEVDRPVLAALHADRHTRLRRARGVFPSVAQ